MKIELVIVLVVLAAVSYAQELDLQGKYVEYLRLKSF